jgi:hypothetical protein
MGLDDYLASSGTVDGLYELADDEPPEKPPTSTTPSATSAHLHTPPVEAPKLPENKDILAAMVVCTELCMGLVGEHRSAKLVYLMFTSRLLREPVNGVVKGLSSSGKSFSIECVVRLMPPEAYYQMTSMSQRALIYLEEDMRHRTIVLFEAAALRESREKAEDNIAAYIVRSLLSEGRIEYPTVTKGKDGKLATTKIVREGPTNLITSTTSLSLHPENETRMLSLPSDDSRDQTRRVLRAIAEDRKRRDTGPDRMADIPAVASRRQPRSRHSQRSVPRGADTQRRGAATPRLHRRPATHQNARSHAPTQPRHRPARPHRRKRPVRNFSIHSVFHVTWARMWGF